MKKLSVSMTRLETALGWFYFVFQLLFLGSIVVVINMFLPEPLSLTELNVLVFIINLVSILLIFHKFLWKNLQITIKAFSRTLRSAVYGFLLYYGCSILISIFIVMIMPDFANVNDSNISQMVQENYTLMAISTVLFVPIVEETLYRGLLFRSLYNLNPIVGYAVSSAFFALIHVVGYIGSYDWATLGLCFLQYIPAGLFLAWAYVRADSIWAPILIHITVNQIGILASR